MGGGGGREKRRRRKERGGRGDLEVMTKLSAMTCRPLNLQLKSAMRCGCGQQHLHQGGRSTLHVRNAALFSACKIVKF